MWKRLSQKSGQGWVKHLSKYVAQHLDRFLTQTHGNLLSSFFFCFWEKSHSHCRKKETFQKTKRKRGKFGPIFDSKKENLGQMFDSTAYISMSIYICISWRVTPLSTSTPNPSYPTTHVRITPPSTCIWSCKYRYLGGFGAVPAVLCGFGNYVGSGGGVPQHARWVSDKRPVFYTTVGHDF